jgi:uncharacterized protein (DUF1810 family)
VKPITIVLASVSIALLGACGGGGGGGGGDAGDAMGDTSPVGDPQVTPSASWDISTGETATYTVSGLDDSQAYRVTLVVAANLASAGDGTGTFVDANDDGAADAGASENVALISMVNGAAVTAAKTVPAGTDDPAAPSGVFPVAGQISITVTGVGAGAVYPVAYTNAGASTFLELDGSGVPTEPYGVGGLLTVAAPVVATPDVTPQAARTIDAGSTAAYTIDGLDDAQAYRITLVVAANLTAGVGGTGTFVDADANGAADAGASENVALITALNGIAVPGAKTVPAGTDDPADPSGVFPVDGKITLVVTGVDAGTIYPVAYTNAGASTFLELDGSGVPTEPYGVGGAVTVNAAEPDFTPNVEPAAAQTIDVGATQTYTISGLDDAEAYRVTLVVVANLTAGVGGTGTFVDADANGAADAGASENVALISMVQGAAVTPAKTVPAGTDDPADPTGVFPVGGEITITVTGVGAGAVYPVAYTNAGASTFLELDTSGVPTEPYGVGGLLTVNELPDFTPNVEPAAAQTIDVGATQTYTISGLDDAQAYRVTLVVVANLTAGVGGTGTFVDADANGAADAGASENVALISMVQGAAVTPAKTVPAGTDDPAAPTGVFPVGGEITITVTGVGAGAVYPVAYTNAGASTFLELDTSGVPTEPYGVGGLLTVNELPDFTPNVEPAAAQTIDVGATQTYTISGLDDAEAYRVTLVVVANLTAGVGGTGTFVDADANGAADAGASENVALISMVQGAAVTPAKTVPAGTDDPAAPTGVFPVGGEITITVTGVGAGAVYPVAYTNAGASTFLELDTSGVPTEPYGVGGLLTVNELPDFTPNVEPAAAQTIDVGATQTYTISGLDDAEAYRVTLVVVANLTAGVGGTGTFVDADANGAADAGASENVALISMVQGAAVTPAKTVPAGTDDPAAPTGVFPVGGEITITVTGVGAGAVYPVAYTNAGASTFLELDGSGVPIEPYGVGGLLTVAPVVVPGPPNVEPQASTGVLVGDEVTFTIDGLTDAQAYRVTLVIGANLLATGAGTGIFVDDDANGAADAGPSETVALITAVNGAAVTGAKTVPAGTDDPADPTGVFPVGGEITITVTGVGAGTVYPVAYENGGDSTFLEVDGAGMPLELYGVGGALSVGAGPPNVQPLLAQGVTVGGAVSYTIDGLDDTQAYRVTLVVGANLTAAGDGSATFIDLDANGAADAGASEAVALITMVNDEVVTGAKTIPAGTDDPANPSAIFPVGGQITLEVTGVGVGTVYPVAYTNAGASTFLELDGGGVPIEPYGVGGALVVGSGVPEVLPAVAQSISVDDTTTYTISGLDDAEAYRVTLVVVANLTAGVGGTGTFVDADANGAADAGASENVALISMVQGAAVTPAKTVPAGTDDPANPSAIFPVGGEITITITGVAAGAVYPVAYTNAGASTFLELDGGGVPIEPYGVGGLLTVL